MIDSKVLVELAYEHLDSYNCSRDDDGKFVCSSFDATQHLICDYGYHLVLEVLKDVEGKTQEELVAYRSEIEAKIQKGRGRQPKGDRRIRMPDRLMGPVKPSRRKPADPPVLGIGSAFENPNPPDEELGRS